MVFKRRFTQTVMITFLRRLLRTVESKVFLIIDGHPVHRGRELKRWLAERAERLEVFFLPGYAPDLNPDELLNQDVKSNALGRRRPADQSQMIADVRGYLRSTQNQPDVVRSYFQEAHVQYAAEP